MKQSTQDRARDFIVKLRRTPVGISEVIPILQQLIDDLDAAQAKLDKLMLEYEPSSLTPEQLQRWSQHQRPYPQHD
jgi:hypothetical protein